MKQIYFRHGPSKWSFTVSVRNGALALSRLDKIKKQLEKGNVENLQKTLDEKVRPLGKKSHAQSKTKTARR